MRPNCVFSVCSSRPNRAAILAALLVCAVCAVTPTANAQTESVLYNICSLNGCADGDGGLGSLILDSDGNLYGTNYGGGLGSGNVFRLTPRGIETVIYNFGSSGGDGSGPQGALAMDSAGDLYGVTVYGGAHSQGTLFKVTRQEVETILHTFNGGNTDGSNPYGPVVLDARGSVYGTAFFGGAYGAGILYRVSPSGRETILHTFAVDGTDGYFPHGLTMDRHGNLFGVTVQGGAYFRGAVYELSNRGVYSVLYSFGQNPLDGAPNQTVIVDHAGNLYGTGQNGGTFGHGDIFKLVPGGPWTETLLYSFGTDSNDGSGPVGPLAIDSRGDLYGVTVLGGTNNTGTAFRITPTGAEEILYNFLNSTDGGYPLIGVALDSSGDIFGATGSGGLHSLGVIFELTP